MTERWKFDGPNGAVEIAFPEGRALSVAPGDEVDLTPAEAEAVGKLPGWAPVKPKNKTKETVE